MEERPKIKLSFTPIDKAFEITGWLMLFSIWILVIANYSEMPDVIPNHYDITGKADGYGGKSSVLGLVSIATALFAGLTILNKFPHIFNYPGKVTEVNALVQYKNSTRFIRYLKLVIVILFWFIAFKTIQHAKGTNDDLGMWVLPLTLGLIFIPLVYTIIKSIKAK